MDSAGNPPDRHLKSLPSRLPHVLLWIASISVAVAGVVAMGLALG